MHPSCVGEFEDVVNYDEWVGKVEGTYYCPMHHPWKDRIDDSEDEGSPKKLPAADNHESNVLETNQCDWRFSSLGCMYPELPLLTCQHEGCTVSVHHLCQTDWHRSVDYEAPQISRYCRRHDSHYANTRQLPLLPTGGEVLDFGGVMDVHSDGNSVASNEDNNEPKDNIHNVNIDNRYDKDEDNDNDDDDDDKDDYDTQAHTALHCYWSIGGVHDG